MTESEDESSIELRLAEALQFLRQIGFEADLSFESQKNAYTLAFRKPAEKEPSAIVTGTAEQVLAEMGNKISLASVMPEQIGDLRRQLKEQLRLQNESLQKDRKPL